MSRCVYILMLLLFFGLGFVKAEDSVVSDGLQYSELIEQNEFYENVRIGTTFFELGKYAQASHFLEKAYCYRPSDEHVSELLYWAYVNMGRDMEAKRVYSELSPERLEHKPVFPKVLSSAYVEGGALLYSQKGVEVPEGSLYSEDFDQQGGAYVMLTLTHDVAGGFQIGHGFNYLNTSGKQRADSAMVAILDGSTDYEQYGYLVNLRAALPRQWRVSLSGYLFGTESMCTAVSLDTTQTEPDKRPGFNDGWHNNWWGYGYNPYYGGFSYMGWWAPYYPIWGDMGKLPAKVAYNTTPVQSREFGYVAELAAQKYYKALEFELALSYSNFWESLWQTSAAVSYYPYGDGRLYLRTLLAGVFADSGSKVIFEEKVGGRICGDVWGECAFAAGDMSGFNENELANVYVLQDRTKYRVSANVIYAVSERLSVSFLYKFMEREGVFYYFDGSGYLHKESKRVFSNNLIGGLRWNF